MTSSPDEQLALQRASNSSSNSASEGGAHHAHASELERPLLAVEDSLTNLALALHRQDVQAVDRVAAELHAALAAAVDHFGRAAKAGGVPPLLRRRLAMASGQVAAQREALARATASLDRAMDVLMPRQAAAHALYSAAGSAERAASSGALLA